MLQVMNGPQVMAAFAALGTIGTSKVLSPAVKDGAEVIAKQWKAEAPKFEHYFEESIQVDVGGEGTGEIGSDLEGTLARIYPHPVAGVPDDEQPARYAGILEFGGQLGPRQRNSYIPANPSGRRAIQAAGDECVDTIESQLHAAIAALGLL
jgi:phage gpG-like protein